MAHKIEDLKIVGRFLVVGNQAQMIILDHIERIHARFEGQCKIVTSSGFELKVEAPTTKVVEFLRQNWPKENK